MKWVWTVLYLIAAISIWTTNYPEVWMKICAFMWFFSEFLRSVGENITPDDVSATKVTEE